MTDVSADTTTASTTLQPDTPLSPSGGGKVAPEAEEAPKPSLRDTIAEEMKKGAAPKEEAPAKEKEPAKDDASDAAKPTDADKAEEGKAADKANPEAKGDAKSEEAAEARTSDVKDGDAKGEGEAADKTDKPGHYQPPKTFLADSREKWTNVPRPVQRDIDNMAREYETRVEALTKATERYERLREYDELAQSNGHDLTESLRKMGEIEDGLQTNPIATLNRILLEAGPRKPDGSPVTLREVAQYIAQQDEQGYNRIVSAQPQQQNQAQQPNPEMQRLQDEIAQLKVQQVVTNVIEPFKRDHPRYDELRIDIARLMKSGMISSSLSEVDRLAVAYDMAERLKPSSSVEANQTKPSPDAQDRVDDSSGTKSIKSAPGSVSSDHAPKRGGSTADILRDEMRRRRAS